MTYEYDRLSRDAFRIHTALLQDLEQALLPASVNRWSDATLDLPLDAMPPFGGGGGPAPGLHTRLLDRALGKGRAALEQYRDRVHQWSFSSEPGAAVGLTEAEVVPLASLRGACPAVLQGRLDQLVVVFRTLIDEANRYWAAKDQGARAAAECHRQRALILVKHTFAFPCTQLACKFVDFYQQHYKKIYLPQEGWYVEQERLAHDEQRGFYERFDPFVQQYAGVQGSLIRVLRREIEALRVRCRGSAQTQTSGSHPSVISLTNHVPERTALDDWTGKQLQQLEEELDDLERQRDVWSTSSSAARHHAGEAFNFFPLVPTLHSDCCKWMLAYQQLALRILELAGQLLAGFTADGGTAGPAGAGGGGGSLAASWLQRQSSHTGQPPGDIVKRVRFKLPSPNSTVRAVSDVHGRSSSCMPRERETSPDAMKLRELAQASTSSSSSPLLSGENLVSQTGSPNTAESLAESGFGVSPVLGSVDKGILNSSPIASQNVGQDAAGDDVGVEPESARLPGHDVSFDDLYGGNGALPSDRNGLGNGIGNGIKNNPTDIIRQTSQRNVSSSTPGGADVVPAPSAMVSRSHPPIGDSRSSLLSRPTTQAQPLLERLVCEEMVDMLRFVGQDARSRLQAEGIRAQRAAHECQRLYETVKAQRAQRDQCFALAAQAQAPDLSVYRHPNVAPVGSLAGDGAGATGLAAGPAFFQNPVFRQQPSPVELTHALLRLEDSMGELTRRAATLRADMEHRAESCEHLRLFAERVMPPIEQFLGRLGSLGEAWKAAAKEEHMFIDAWQALRQRYYEHGHASLRKWDTLVAAETEAIFASQRHRVAIDQGIVLSHYQRALEQQLQQQQRFAATLEARWRHVDGLLEEINQLHQRQYEQQLQTSAIDAAAMGAPNAFHAVSALAGYQQVLAAVASLRSRVAGCVDFTHGYQDRLLAWRLRLALLEHAQVLDEMLQAIQNGKDGEGKRGLFRLAGVLDSMASLRTLAAGTGSSLIDLGDVVYDGTIVGGQSAGGAQGGGNGVSAPSRPLFAAQVRRAPVVHAALTGFESLG